MKYRGLLFPMILAAMSGDDAFALNTQKGERNAIYIQKRENCQNRKRI